MGFGLDLAVAPAGFGLDLAAAPLGLGLDVAAFFDPLDLGLACAA